MAKTTDDQTIDRIYDKIDEVGKQLSAVAIDVAVLKSRPLHEQPCPQLTSHLAEHAEVKRDWRQAIIAAVTKVAIAAIIAAFSFQFGRTAAAEPDATTPSQPIETHP